MSALRSRGVVPFVFLIALTVCTGDAGPTGPGGTMGSDGPQGPIGPQGPVYAITAADLLGTWTGDMITEDPTSLAFVSVGVRTITFNGDGTYASDIFTNGGASETGSFLVLPTSVAVTVPNTGFTPFVTAFPSVAAVADSLMFILPVRPTGVGFQTLSHTVYMLARQ